MPREPAGDPVSAALEMLIARFDRIITSVGLRHGLQPSDIDELFQDVRVRLWRARTDPERLRAVPSSYVYQTAVSAVLDRARARRSHAGDTSLEEADASALPSVPAEAERLMEVDDLAAVVERALGTLTPNRRTIVRLYLVGYDRTEIAELVRWSEAKVRNLLYRGLDDLREALRHAGIPLWDREDR